MNHNLALERHLTSLLADLDATLDADSYAVIALRLAKLVASRDLVEGRKWLQEGMRRITPARTPHLQAKYLLAVAALRCGTPDLQRAALNEAYRLWAEHPPGLIAVERERGLLAAEACDWIDSAAAFTRALDLLPAAADDLRADLQDLRAHALLSAGDPAAALAGLTLPITSTASTAERLRAFARWQLLCLCHCANQDPQRALACAHASLQLLPPGDPLRLGPLLTCAELHLAHHAPLLAEAPLAEARALLSSPCAPSLTARWHLCNAQTLRAAHPDQAHAALHIARSFAQDDPALLSQIDAVLQPPH